MKTKISLYIMGGIYVVAGFIHLLQPSVYIGLMPSWIPAPFFCIILSGIAEIILGALLLLPTFRIFAAWMIILMLIIFEVLIHIPMALDYYTTGNDHLWIALLRLPLQLVLIWWAGKYTKNEGR